MSIVITILKVIAALVVVLLLVALLVKKEFSLQKEVTINKPKQEVFDYLKLIKKPGEIQCLGNEGSQYKNCIHGC